MKRGVVWVVGLLALGTGCGEGAKAFVGEYEASGTRTLSVVGSAGTEEVSGGMSISEGVRSELTIANENNCVIPADLNKQVVTLAKMDEPLVCDEYVTTAQGERVKAFLTVNALSAIRGDDGVITLTIEGIATANYRGFPLQGELKYDLKLTPAAR